MKTLIAGIVLILVLGIGGFVYRNVLESRSVASPSATACTLEAKICPDGTTVGRTGPNCEFSPCSFPNISIDSAGIAFALPAGYVEDDTEALPDPYGIGQYIKTSSSTSAAADMITIIDYPVLTGSTTQEVMIDAANSMSSGAPRRSMSDFTPKIIGTRTFSEITTDQFEGVVTTHYYLPRASDVLDFSVTEAGVAGWNKPDLIPDNLPEHQALIRMLGTLEDSTPATS